MPTKEAEMRIHRRHLRASIALEAHDRLIAFEAAIAPMASAMVPVLNVSRTGMFLGLDCNVALGIKFDFKMTFDGTETPVFGQAQVMWQRRKSGETIKPGVGIEILSFKDDGRSAYLRFLEDCFMVLTVSDLMHENIVTVPPSATVAATVEAMCKADVGSAMIIDDHGGPLGIFTERDMLKHATRCDIHRDSVATLMTTELRTISSNASTDDAYQTLRGRKFRHLPVVDSGKLMGTLSTRDLFSYWSELIELYSTRVARDYNHAMGFIVHDLRSPIAVIKSMVNLVGANGQGIDDFMQVNGPEVIGEECDRMMRLIDDLLAVAQPRRGGIRLHKEAFDLDSSVRNAVSKFKPQADAKQISLKLDIHAPIAPILIDSLRWTQILENLLSNALKFSLPGATVSVDLSATPAGATLSVADTGQGIPEDEVKSLFKEFGKTSVKPTAGERSTGLGLAITKKLVEAHGGSINVNSVVNKGTKFTVFLPV